VVPLRRYILARRANARASAVPATGTTSATFATCTSTRQPDPTRVTANASSRSLVAAASTINNADTTPTPFLPHHDFDLVTGEHRQILGYTTNF